MDRGTGARSAASCYRHWCHERFGIAKGYCRARRYLPQWFPLQSLQLPVYGNGAMQLCQPCTHNLAYFLRRRGSAKLVSHSKPEEMEYGEYKGLRNQNVKGSYCKVNNT